MSTKTTVPVLKAKNLTYQDRLLQSQEEKKSQDVSFQVEGAALQLKADLLANKKKLAEATKKLEELKGSETFDTIAIVNKQLEVNDLSQVIDVIQTLESELFTA